MQDKYFSIKHINGDDNFHFTIQTAKIKGVEEFLSLIENDAKKEIKRLQPKPQQ